MKRGRLNSPGAAGASRICAAALAVALHAFGAEAAAAPARFAPVSTIAPKHAQFGSEAAPADVRHIADWALDAGDHEGLPFMVIDKKRARVYVFSANGSLFGAAPVLLGRAVGDAFAPGVADMDMYDTEPWQRVTPAGRFLAESYRKPNGQWILWIDYDSAIALHKVVLTNAGEQRDARIAAVDINQRRITYGCINVPVDFYDRVIHPTFKRSNGIVYVLPETRPVEAVFGSYRVSRSGEEDTVPGRAAVVSAAGMALVPSRAEAPNAPHPFDRPTGGTKPLPQGRRPNGTPEAAVEGDS